MKKLRYWLLSLLVVCGATWATVESATYISDLNTSNPAAGDSLTEGDDHIRLLKSTIKATFPNVAGAVTPTHTELNYVDGVTSAIQTQIDAKPNTSQIGLTLIATATAAGSPTIDFTASINSTYDEYELHFSELVPATNDVRLEILTSVDGSTWPASSGDYDWAILDATGTATSVTNGSTTATEIRLGRSGGGNGVSNTAAVGGVSGVVRFHNPSGTSHNKRFQWEIGYGASTAGSMHIVSGRGARMATAAIVGVRIKFSSGNISTGTVRLYGVRKT